MASDLPDDEHPPASRSNSREIDTTCDQFKAAWLAGEEPLVEEYLGRTSGADDAEASRQLLLELVMIDLEHRWRRASECSQCETPASTDETLDVQSAIGKGPLLEDYADRFPALGPVDRFPADAIAFEYRVRHALGDQPGHAEYFERFPEKQNEVNERLREIDEELGQNDETAGRSVPQMDTDRQSDAQVYGTVSAECESQVESAEVAPIPVPSDIGRYRIAEAIGHGGFGQVYLARDDQLERSVAIKVPHARLVGRAEHAAAYLAEARVLASLEHPHIVPVYDVGSTEEFPCYFVMKYVEGIKLTELIARGPLEYARSAETVAVVADSLHYAHKRGLVHRDIKPGNILIDREGAPSVVDFGLALKEQEMGKGPVYAGTPAYMSPEQARGEGHRVDGRSDIYSLGAVLYEMLTGRRTFKAESPAELMAVIASQEARPPRQIDDRIPKELERICLRALSRRASERYTTAKDLADELRHFLAENFQATSDNRSSSEVVADGESTVASDTPPLAPDSDSRPIKIVPKGLRSFDENDAEFFLELLPGPRDRDGLPDSIRFWKTRIEETDPDDTFSVGLIYGPSGCGKSSLFKAGLLPRLAGHVVSVYVEATPEETEGRLLKGLRKRCPSLPADSSLPEAVAALRRGGGVADKVVIVLDQFEQWLHANRAAFSSELIEALRHCDGGRVQCVLLVRDDFWMAATEFFQELEIRLIEARNSAAVHLFDLRHARKVLESFGRAFGTLPEDRDDLTKEQNLFLEQAVIGLAQEGKVICVRLSLFAEMMKGRPWTPAALKAVGGTAGIGVTFLEETFSAGTAPPEHRLHQRAAAAVLKTLLPEHGVNIRGHRRTRRELLEASGYASNPRRFDTLLEILDGELRLVTPTEESRAEGEEPKAKAGQAPPNRMRPDDPETVSVGESPARGSQLVAESGFYQLTHDYLVPSLREWLTRKQKETRRGRAELRLAERTALWNAKPEKRHLPSWWEWLNIRLFTRASQWTGLQRKMMAKAGRLLGLRWGVAIVFLVALGIAVQQFTSHQRSYVAARELENDRTRAESLVDAVLTAPAEAVPYAIQNLDPLREHAMPILLTRFEDAVAEPGLKLRAAMALAAFDHVEHQFLASSIGNAPAAECRNIVSALERSKDAALRSLQHEAGSADEQWNWRRKARLAITALHLGDTSLARDMFRFRPDPIQQTVLVDVIASWHGDAEQLAASAEEEDDAAFRSGICLGIGSIPEEELTAADEFAYARAFCEWYENAPDSATHSAAGWALRRRRWQLPKIPSSDEPEEGWDWYINSIGMTMLRIPAGKYTPWTPGEEEVTFASDFFLSDREISERSFADFVNDPRYPDEEKSPLGARGSRRDYPVMGVSWFEAVLFCNWLSHKEGLTPCYERTGQKVKEGDRAYDVWCEKEDGDGYRLPTEAEWEYACRAGSATRFVCGNDDALLAKYVVYAAFQEEPCGSKLPNHWGLFDMQGNASEWCQPAGQDWFEERDFHGLKLSIEFGACGGAYNSGVQRLRRTGYVGVPSNNNAELGFRVARICTGKPAGRRKAADSKSQRRGTVGEEKASVWLERGRVLRRMGRNEEAVEALTKAVELDPKNAPAWCERASVHRLLGNLDEAIADYTKAIELNPDEAEYYGCRGHVCGLLSQWEQAAADYAKCIQLDPDNETARYRHALLQLPLKNLAAYRSACQDCLQYYHYRGTRSPLTANLAAWTCSLGPDALDDFARVVALARRAAGPDPSSHSTLNTLGAVLYRAGEFDEAVKTFDEAIKLQGAGGTPWDWLYLAMTHHQLDAPEEAQEWLDKAVKWLDDQTAGKENQSPLQSFFSGWESRLEVILLREEAESLIRVEPER